ncbi:hypothetical protein [Pyrodictium abyssi]|uniref:Uncharacterized protein n=1 Tax=Pyrodictium abyssi TaxID=54256 RepID=A0ABN6ZV28_9CREN|nr:hypothetical protein PABY_24500 [Pyrodictium abyssi]
MGLYLAQLLHDYYNGGLARLAKLDNTADLEALLVNAFPGGGQGHRHAHE